MTDQREDTCTWPWHHPECDKCREWDQIAGENLDRFLAEKAAEKEARRVQRKQG